MRLKTRNWFLCEINCDRSAGAILWLTTMDKWIGANFNHRRSMKTETRRQIPHKLATRLKFVLSWSGGGNHWPDTTAFYKC